jgi:exodeoxyribonuclease-3
MKIATYNVNGINGRLDVLLRWLEEAKPDVAYLQELKAPDEKFPIAAVRKLGYGPVWHGQKAWNGVAILARNMMKLDASTVRCTTANRQCRRRSPRAKAWRRGGRTQRDRGIGDEAEYDRFLRHGKAERRQGLRR